MFGGGKNSKPEKCSKNAPSPTCRVHALLGAIGLEDSLAEKRYRRQDETIFAQNLTFGNDQKT
jgi:hypothetical protein